MALPTYSTDLTTISAADDVSNWDESSNSAWDDAGSMVQETNFFIQNAECISTQFTKDGQGTIMTTTVSGIVVPADGAILFWHYWASPPSLAALAAGGIKMLIGMDFGNFRAWNCSGSDFEPAPLGGWYNFAVNPIIPSDDSVGDNYSPYTSVGCAVNATAQARGNPHAVDAIRYGRCDARYSGGQSGSYATFAGFSAINDLVANRWALLSSIPGVPSGYRWQGLMTLGYASVVDFRDSNRNIFAANALNVTAGFHKIEIRQALSNVEWTSISIAAAGTVSRGQFEMIDNATVAITSCTFTDMDTFIFLSNANILSTIFRRCEQLTQGSASFTSCLITDSTSNPAMLSDNPTLISNSEFVSAGTGHAMELDTPGTYTVSSMTFTGYGVDGTTDAAIYNNSGGLVTLNVSGGVSPTYLNGSGASTVVNNSVALTIVSNTTLVGAEVRIYDMDNLPAGSLGTELSGVESNPTANYVFSGSGGNVIWLQIMKDGYVEFGQELTMPSVNGDFTALLKADLNA